MSEKNTLSIKWWILGLLTPPLVWADLYTKVLIGRKFYPGERLTVIDGFFDLMFARNRGAAFGLFNDLSPELSFAFFIGVSIIALLVLGYLFTSISHYEKYMAVTITFIFAGALGNFTDRMRLGYVVDFLHFYVKDFYWPTFNVADICITVGAVMLVYYSIFLEPREDEDEQSLPGAQSAGNAGA